MEGELSRLVGMTSTHGAEQVTMGLVKMSGPTYTTLSWPLPGSGTHTLTSVVKPRWLESLCRIPEPSMPAVIITVATVNRL
jgi:hypothetical protein